jgi:hypothetical protein
MSKFRVLNVSLFSSTLGIYSDAQPWASLLGFYFRERQLLLLMVKVCQKWSLPFFGVKGFLGS